MSLIIKHLCAIALTLSLQLYASCAMYHLQTPETVPPGKVTTGMGWFGQFYPNDQLPWGVPGFWIRTGITPKIDIGVHTWFMGVKVDGKYCLNRYLGLGCDLAAGGYFDYTSVVAADISLYTALPLGSLTPYVVARAGELSQLEPNHDDYFVFTVSAAAGFQWRMSKGITLYLETGFFSFDHPGDERFETSGIISLGIESHY